jgi:hypothetical protein
MRQTKRRVDLLLLDRLGDDVDGAVGHDELAILLRAANRPDQMTRMRRTI